MKQFIKLNLLVPQTNCLSDIPSKIGLILYIICVITLLIIIIIKFPYIAKELLKISTIFTFIIIFVLKIWYYMIYCGNIIEVILTIPFNLIITFGTPMLMLYAELGNEFIPYLNKLNKIMKKMKQKITY